MFGRDFMDFRHSMFDDDPFFNHHRNAMQSMMPGFGDPFSMGHRAIGAPDENRSRARGNNRQRPGQELMPHSQFMGDMMGPMSMFSNMDSMFRNMQQNMERMSNDPNSFSYSSSSVMTYSNDGNGQPKYYHATSSERKAPGGVRETQKSMRDSSSGTEKMMLGQHIGERGHEYQRSRNFRTGEEEEIRNYMNMDEEEAPHFDRQWRDATRQRNAALGYREHHGERNDRRHRGHRTRAIKDLDRP